MTADRFHAVVEDALHSRHFFHQASELHSTPATQVTVPWEFFRGNLLDAGQTRLEQTFVAWQIQVTGAIPLQVLAIYWDQQHNCLFVVRGLSERRHTAYEEGGALLTREVDKVHFEHVGTIPLRDGAESGGLVRQLQHCLFRAVIGTSRLPVTSLESPMPGFSLGSLGYFPGLMSDHENASLDDLIRYVANAGAEESVRAKALELWLRAVPAEDAADSARSLLTSWPRAGHDFATLAGLLRVLFNHVALSPLGRLLDNLVALLTMLAETSPAGMDAACDVVSYWLRHLGRHLAAYDLETFHNFGANYPDALVLDALLRLYVSWIEMNPSFFKEATGRMRRRALRQGWFYRKVVEGLPVPARPTSLGENRRLLPDHPIVPEHELLTPNQRPLRLFANAPAEEFLTAAVRQVLDQSLSDLNDSQELLELGMATYLDRPLGIYKAPAEVDRTTLLSYEAFSRTLARNRLNHWRAWGLLDNERHASLATLWEAVARPVGIPVMDLPGQERPGVVALEDARRAQPDFTFTRTTRSSVDALLRDYDFGAACKAHPSVWQWLSSGRKLLLIRSPRAAAGEAPDWLMTAYDAELRPRVRLRPAGAIPPAYEERCGQEWLAHGLELELAAGERYPVAPRVECGAFPPL